MVNGKMVALRARTVTRYAGDTGVVMSTEHIIRVFGETKTG